MDNRKTYRAYKEKLRVASAPYPVSGIFSKVKRLFSPRTRLPTVPSNESEVPKPSTVKSESSTSITPFQYPEPNRKNLSRSVSVNSFKMPGSYDIGSSPNKVLSTFFQQKGDEPISQVEYEGIVSLMNKSKSEVGNDTDFLENQINNTFLKDPSLRGNSSLLYETPYSQKVLKNEGNTSVGVFSTPDYKPIYHTVNDSIGNIPSVKRVYQFSGLPSPYRTRIRAPSLSKKSKSTEGRSKETFNSNHDTIAADVLPSKPRSETASALLSVLNGTSQENISADDKEAAIKRFANPYTSQSRKRAKVQKSIALTSKDINQTLSFDKSVPLPQAKSNPTMQTELDAKFGEGEISNKKNESFNTFGGNQKIAEASEKKVSYESPKEPSVTRNLGFSFGVSSSKTADTPQPKRSSVSKKNEVKPVSLPSLPKQQEEFAGGKSDQIKVGQSKTDRIQEFHFDDPHTTTTTLDGTKVEAYKILFSF